MHKSQSPIFPYIPARIFKNPKKVPQKWPKKGVQVDHSFGHLFDYSAICFENRKSDLEITPWQEAMIPVLMFPTNFAKIHDTHTSHEH